jgi:hypothetical protein
MDQGRAVSGNEEIRISSSIDFFRRPLACAMHRAPITFIHFIRAGMLARQFVQQPCVWRTMPVNISINSLSDPEKNQNKFQMLCAGSVWI